MGLGYRGLEGIHKEAAGEEGKHQGFLCPEFRMGNGALGKQTGRGRGLKPWRPMRGCPSDSASPVDGCAV